MKLNMRPYPKLLKQMKEYFTAEENAEMVALITAAEYEHTTLISIINSKLYTQLPAVASEAVTTVDEIASKVLKNIGEEDEQEAAT